MKLLGRNILLNALYYAVTVGAWPAGVLWLESRWWGLRHPSFSLRVVGNLLGLVAVGLHVWCIILLQRRGGGTPSPVAPPERLVTQGPYAWLRNPLNLGEGLFFLALAAWFGSWALVLYACVALLSFHLFIVTWEEPRQRRVFGSQYVEYAARVNRWLPRRRVPSAPGGAG